MRSVIMSAFLMGAILSSCPVTAQESSTGSRPNSIKVGFAGINFNTRSTELSGRFTPSGITVDAADTATLALALNRELVEHLWVQLAFGFPPVLEVSGAGSAEGIGKILSTRAWPSALLGLFDVPVHERIAPYAGAGVSYTFFTDAKTTMAYDGAFGGPSVAEVQGSVGPVVKVGVEIDLTANWLLELSYSRFWISTSARIATEVPGVGPVERFIDVDLDPDVFIVAAGFRF